MRGLQAATVRRGAVDLVLTGCRRTPWCSSGLSVALLRRLAGELKASLMAACAPPTSEPRHRGPCKPEVERRRSAHLPMPEGAKQRSARLGAKLSRLLCLVTTI